MAVLSDNRVKEPSYRTENGLYILLKADLYRILLDTGASDVFIRNAERMGVYLRMVDYVFISHGQDDHVGAVQFHGSQQEDKSHPITRNHLRDVLFHEKCFARHHFDLARGNGIAVDHGEPNK